MSDTINNGGPAFPHFSKSRQHSSDGHTFYQGIEVGMTLRDYFAAKAMQEMTWHEDKYLDAVECYAIADAMLLARESK